MDLRGKNLQTVTVSSDLTLFVKDDRVVVTSKTCYAEDEVGTILIEPQDIERFTFALRWAEEIYNARGNDSDRERREAEQLYSHMVAGAVSPADGGKDGV